MGKDKFTFNISLSILHHLGRSLYRSFATVLGEAISNAWDADAENVHIYIKKGKNGKDNFFIKDDGTGMNAKDIQDKFLRIGYSKRKERQKSKKKNRAFIGRKGIGKLALLSCADKVTVISKVLNGEYRGGVIDNSKLDKVITDDLDPKECPLGPWKSDDFSQYMSGHDHGTIVMFENVKNGINRSSDFLIKTIALYFRFSLLDPSFNIYIDDEKITLDHLKDLAKNTQFLWNINDLDDPYIDKLTNLAEAPKSVQIKMPIRGFIASVKKPRDLAIITTEERVSVDLFVNGRLREKDILKHIPTSRLPENYFYGQIHFNGLDDAEDRFTSSREGIIANDPKYKEFLKSLRREIMKILEQWDEWRRKHRQDGDPDNKALSPEGRKAEELYNAVSQKYDLPKSSPSWGKVDGLLNDLRDDAGYNLHSYTECFISENLLRAQIRNNGDTPKKCENPDKNGKTCEDRYDPKKGNTSRCAYCKGEMGKKNLQKQKQDAKTAIQMRVDENDLLMYLDYVDLAKIVGNTILNQVDKSYKPLRNSVMHTSRLTKEGKTNLTAVFDNIVATIKTIL